MAKYIISSIALLLVMWPALAAAQQVAQMQNNTVEQQTYNSMQSYINRSYPQYQGADNDYRLPTQHNNKYYQQEPERIVGQYGNQRTAQQQPWQEPVTYQQQYYYYY